MALLRQILAPIRRKSFPGSAGYWERRYAKGGNSGAGSYGVIARFKADILNTFVTEHSVSTVIELGCGDGHQLSLAKYPAYVGLDVAPTALSLCESRFRDDDTKAFRLYSPGAFRGEADLALSLDVLLHLVEEDVFETYMRDLFSAANRYVVIFSPDRDEENAAHVRYRRFRPWVEEHAVNWKLNAVVENPYKGAESLADFYFYAREV